MNASKDPEIIAIEGQMAKLASERRRALDTAESMTHGLAGWWAGVRGDRESRIDEALRTADRCKVELEQLRKDRERRISQVDPVRAAKMAEMEEHQILMERAAALRKRGGPQVALLDSLESERRSRQQRIAELEHHVYLASVCTKAVDQYVRKLRSEGHDLNSDKSTLTGRVGATASTGTAGAEAREQVLMFEHKTAIDLRVDRLAAHPEVDIEQEATRCARTKRRLMTVARELQAELDSARAAIRPIETGYRNLLSSATRVTFAP